MMTMNILFGSTAANLFAIEIVGEIVGFGYIWYGYIDKIYDKVISF